MIAALRSIHLLALLTAASLSPAWSSAGMAEDITGTWLADDGEAAVRIAACGQAAVCARIVWLKDPVDAAGRPRTDDKNPSPTLRSRPLCGLEIVTGLKPLSGGSWDGGRIYDPDEGKSYDVAMRRAGPDLLKVTGYLGVMAFGQTIDWRRAPKALAQCRGEQQESRLP